MHCNEQSVCNLALTDGLDSATNHAGCYIITADVDAWHPRFAAAGLDVTPVEDMPWVCTNSRSPTRAATTSASAETFLALLNLI